MSKYDELRKLAGAATPGPWIADDLSDDYIDYSDHPDPPKSVGWFRKGPGNVDVGDYDTLTAEDAQYIAAASPDVILALLDERERLSQALWHQAVRRHKPGAGGCVGCREAAELLNRVASQSTPANPEGVES